jgi:hypothetical protein
MNAAVIDIQWCAGVEARSGRPFRPGEPDDDDITVKDVFDCVPKRTSRSVRYAFETFGYAIRRFVKMPGRGFYCLQVRRKSAAPCANDKEARQRVVQILDSLDSGQVATISWLPRPGRVSWSGWELRLGTLRRPMVSWNSDQAA